MKQYVPVYLQTIALVAVFFFMVACGHKNPVLQNDPKDFAKAVDSYFQSIGDNTLRVCASYYYDPQKAKKVAAQAILRIDVDKLPQDCKKPLQALADNLQTTPQFKGITLEDLATTDTWKAYFNASNHHMGDFFDDGKEAQKFNTWKKQY